MPTLNLITHCGAEKVERQQVFDVVTPERTDTWVPLSLDNCGLRVVTEAHALSHNNGRYFGLLQVAKKDDSRVIEAEILESSVGDFTHAKSAGDDYSWVVGLRNSHDKTYPAGLLLGTQVFVCDNLAFNGEIKIARKNTVFCERDLPRLVSQGVGRLVEKWHDNDKRINAYKQIELVDREAHDLIVRAIDNGAICGSQVPKVLKEYRTPSHPEFAESHNVWRLFNAVTEVAKDNSLFALPKRTEALHGLLDGHCGLILSN